MCVPLCGVHCVFWKTGMVFFSRIKIYWLNFPSPPNGGQGHRKNRVHHWKFLPDILECLNTTGMHNEIAMTFVTTKDKPRQCYLWLVFHSTSVTSVALALLPLCCIRVVKVFVMKSSSQAFQNVCGLRRLGRLSHAHKPQNKNENVCLHPTPCKKQTSKLFLDKKHHSITTLQEV